MFDNIEWEICPFLPLSWIRRVKILYSQCPTERTTRRTCVFYLPHVPGVQKDIDEVVLQPKCTDQGLKSHTTHQRTTQRYSVPTRRSYPTNSQTQERKLPGIAWPFLGHHYFACTVMLEIETMGQECRIFVAFFQYFSLPI